MPDANGLNQDADDSSSEGILELAKWVFEQFGAGGLIAAFVCFIFWKLIWNVWSSAMRSKDEEIQRLVDERNKLQEYLMENRISSRDPEILQNPSEDNEAN